MTLLDKGHSDILMSGRCQIKNIPSCDVRTLTSNGYCTKLFNAFVIIKTSEYDVNTLSDKTANKEATEPRVPIGYFGIISSKVSRSPP